MFLHFIKKYTSFCWFKKWSYILIFIADKILLLSAPVKSSVSVYIKYIFWYKTGGFSTF